ncbi:MAG TPA: hypothetical protein VK203_01110 [Nostocaceae cyanobacterium]|nr:hypothetical protein [Nostocaceae cyanobacterium]
MTDKSLLNGQTYYSIVQSQPTQTGVQNEQDRVYCFFLNIIHKWTPEAVLQEFKRLFIDCLSIDQTDTFTGIYDIFSFEQEQEFYHTIKRCCYILINNWETARKYKYIQELIGIFNDYQIHKNIVGQKNSVYQAWLNNFLDSQDYKNLKLFTAKFEVTNRENWTKRYTAYSLLAQSYDENNSQEQREAARKLYKRIKDRFKFDLAMYVAYSQSSTKTTSGKKYKNPSLLGDNVLRLIKIIVSKKGTFNYVNIANIFIEQTQGQTLKEFKFNLQKYLLFSVEAQNFVEVLQKQLAEKLSAWKSEQDQEFITKDLFLRICNRVIDFLTTENTKEPSTLFTSVLSQGHSLTLVIILLKVILISKNSRAHLETRIAHLINYYEQYPAEECKWLINFIEIFNVTFAIYTENVEYNLVKMRQDQQDIDFQINLDDYRVFSQLRLNPDKEI